MKKLGLLLVVGALILGSLPAIAEHRADNFEVVKDGKIYVCTPKDEHLPPDPRVEIECANTANQGFYSKAEALELCRGARDMGPLECADHAQTDFFSKKEAILLCQQDGSIKRAECAIDAIRDGLYKKDQAIKLCKSL